MIFNSLKKLLPDSLKKKLFYFINGYSNQSYSQEGEDMVLNRIFSGKKNGFYIDIGAHHPKRFSNTYFFYQKGWKGINVDAMPGSMKIFKRLRPRDINVEVPVASTNTKLTYYAFEEPAYNSLSESLSKERIDAGIKLLFKKDIETKRLDELLEKYISPQQQIDFLTIDVEGFDMDVLKSNNWEKYKPSAVVVETYGSTLSDVLESDICEFLKSKGYIAKAKTANTSVFTLTSL